MQSSFSFLDYDLVDGQLANAAGGLINPKDNEVTKKKAEQLALDSFSGLTHYPKMGAYSYTLPGVFEPQSDNKPGPEGGPAKPITANTPDGEPMETSNKGTSNLCCGCMSPFVAGAAGKPRIQAKGFTDTATKNKEHRQAPLYLPVRQE
jgi:hypothetical protein